MIIKNQQLTDLSKCLFFDLTNVCLDILFYMNKILQTKKITISIIWSSLAITLIFSN